MGKRVITTEKDLLENIRKIPWTEGYFQKVGPNDLFLGTDWWQEKYDLISSAPEDSIIIDVGCKYGDWSKQIKNLVNKQVIHIGIDPIFEAKMPELVHYYYNVAIDNVDKDSMGIFHLFDESGCNSLLSKSEHLTMRNILSTTTVPIKSLESIVYNHLKLNSVIHYLKCDCQGKDIDVVKSLKSYLSITKYVQIEASFDHNKPFYAGQKSYEEDVIEMDKLGFDPIFYMEYDLSPLPEGEIIFKNRLM